MNVRLLGPGNRRVIGLQRKNNKMEEARRVYQLTVISNMEVWEATPSRSMTAIANDPP